MNGAQALTRQLLVEGVDTIFGLPGVQIMPAFDALYDVRDKLRLVHMRHEQATTYAAFGYASASKKPGVALVVPGPGLLNATAGLGTAYAASQPVLLISGQIPSQFLGKKQGHLHEVDDQLSVVRTITKWTHRVTNPGEIPEVIHEAFRHLKTGRPRPVELEIPPDILMAVDDVQIVEPEEYSKPVGRTLELQSAVELLTKAKRPAIVSGGGAVDAEASSQILSLAEHLQAPVLASPRGKSILPNDHYLFAGVHYYDPDPWQRTVEDADVILVVGTRFLIQGFELKPSQKVIQIDIDPDQIGRTHSVEVAIEADAKCAVEALLKEITLLIGPRDSRRDELEKRKKDFEDRIRGIVPEQTGLLDTIRAELADDAIVISGMTNIGYWAHTYFSSKSPGTYITSSYFGTLGYAFPTSLGAKIAQPDRQVVSLNGDGGFMFNVQELSTAAEHGINTVTVVFNNRAFGASNWDQTYRFNKRYIGTELRNPDLMKLAEAFGIRSIRAEPNDLQSALRIALDAKAPFLIEVPLPNLMPPFQIVS